MVICDQGMIWHGGQEMVTLAGGRDARDGTGPCKGVKFPYVMR